MADLDDLVRLMQAGDAAALDQLARAYGPRLLAVARRHCRSPHDAEDAVQAALENAHTAMKRYRGDGSPLAWLSTLVARGCSRLNRDPRNHPARTLHDVDVDTIADAPRPCACGCNESADASIERNDLARELGDALMTLSRTDRLAFLLAAEGVSSDDIAARFGLTSDAVRSRLKRARKTLRAWIVTHASSSAALPRTRRTRATATRRHDAHDHR